MNRRQLISSLVFAPAATSQPTEDQIATTAREMFNVALAAVAAKGDCPDEGKHWLDWNELSDQRVSGWMALARWHLGVR